MNNVLIFVNGYSIINFINLSIYFERLILKLDFSITFFK